MPVSIKLKQRISDLKLSIETLSDAVLSYDRELNTRSREIAFLRKAYKIIAVARSKRDSKSRAFCHDVAHSRGQILDNVINTSWFLEAVAEAIEMEATD